MKKYFCDHCGKEITEQDGFTGYEINFENYEYPCDLCEECRDKIHAKIDTKIMELLRWKNESK